jgi:hypothetical protein
MIDKTHTGDSINEQKLESDETIEYGLDEKAVFKRLADDIYEKPKAGVREIVANGVTAIVKAVKRGQIEREEGLLSITIRDDGEGSNTLVIQDNGIGIEHERLDKVVTEIGRSSSYKQGDEAGQFGMGFISVFKLVGMDGGVTMKTRSRETDEVIAGVFTNAEFNGYEDLKDDDTPYGTRFEIPVKDDISANELNRWVKQLCQFTRVNVAYERIDSDATVVEDEEWTSQNLEDIIDDSRYYKVENEHLEAVLSPSRTNHTILLDVPVERNRPRTKKTGDLFGRYRGTFTNVDIRLKNENGVVVNGEHEGKTVVEQGGVGAGEVHINSLSEDAVWTPRPVGNREKLEQNEEFWSWLEQQFLDKVEAHKEEFRSVDSVAELRNRDDLEYLPAYAGDIKTSFDYDSELYDIMRLLSKTVTKVESATGDVRGASVNITDIDEDDYIGITINRSKYSDAVDEGADVYQIKSQWMYEPIVKITGCNLLKRIYTDTESEDEYSVAVSSSQDDDYDVCIHTPNGYRRFTIEEVRETYNSEDTQLVAFRPSSDSKISHETDIVDEQTHKVKLTENKWQKLTRIDNVVEYDSYRVYQTVDTVETYNDSVSIDQLADSDCYQYFIVVNKDEIPSDMPQDYIQNRYNKSIYDEIYFVEPDEFDKRINNEFAMVDKRTIDDVATIYYNYRLDQLSDEKRKMVESTFREEYNLILEDVRKTFDMIEP